LLKDRGSQTSGSKRASSWVFFRYKLVHENKRKKAKSRCSVLQLKSDSFSEKNNLSLSIFNFTFSMDDNGIICQKTTLRLRVSQLSFRCSRFDFYPLIIHTLRGLATTNSNLGKKYTMAASAIRAAERKNYGAENTEYCVHKDCQQMFGHL